MNISLNGYDNQVVTFENDNVVVGDLVRISGNNKVTKCSANEDFMGVCVSANEKYAGILMRGYVELHYSGAVPTVGYKNIVPTSPDIVAVKDSPVAHTARLITKVDIKENIIGVIL